MKIEIEIKYKKSRFWNGISYVFPLIRGDGKALLLLLPPAVCGVYWASGSLFVTPDVVISHAPFPLPLLSSLPPPTVGGVSWALGSPFVTPVVVISLVALFGPFIWRILP